MRILHGGFDNPCAGDEAFCGGVETCLAGLRGKPEALLPRLCYWNDDPEGQRTGGGAAPFPPVPLSVLAGTDETTQGFSVSEKPPLLRNREGRRGVTLSVCGRVLAHTHAIRLLQRSWFRKGDGRRW